MELREPRVVYHPVERNELGTDREVDRWLVIVEDGEISHDHIHVGKALNERTITDGSRRDDPR